MAKKRKIPSAVRDAAEWYITRFGDRLSFLGESEGKEYYLYSFPDNLMLGFPAVFQFEDGEVLEIGGRLSLDIIGQFIK